MGKEHHHNINENSSRNIAIAFFLNLIFAIIELVGGLLTNSVAILSDAIHDFGDSLSLGVAYYLQRVSSKKGDSRFSYGYKRFSLLGSVFISVILVIGAVFIMREGVLRVIHPEESNAKGMFLLAILGIIVNGAAVLKLRGGSSHNERAVLLHMMEDVLGWAAVLVASIVMIFVDVPVLDPILSIAITLWVLFNVYKNLKETISIMLQEVPRGINLDKLREEIVQLADIESIHDVHLWTMDGENHILTLHIVIKEGVGVRTLAELKNRVREIAVNFDIGHVTIETEGSDECADCLYHKNPC
ncbi:MAG: cobalt transporter [Bacteroidetes bacterium GWF2_41_61]|nr:MAG: cobalt transporter [Bacteroidetes bacterium GWF2_41_61]OFY88171.1 MAG: cobalt transporter [Bacteroidetes bacterium RIFOXYA12_FULL_40_10]